FSRNVCALSAAVVALVFGQATTSLAQVYNNHTIVTARLVADSTHVQPRQAFTAGVELTIAPGWHVYWENPGDTALPITIGWKLPDGAKASAPRWPVPNKYAETGGATVYGYENETLLMSTITLPPTIAGGSFPMQASVEWLVCDKTCIPGQALLTLTLPAGKPERSDDAATIERFAARVPRGGETSGVRITEAHASRSGDQWRIGFDIDASGHKLRDFFPRTMNGFAIEHSSIAIKGNGIELIALPDDPRSEPKRVSGVAVTDAGTFDVAGAIAPAQAIVPVPASTPKPQPQPDSAAERAPASDWLSHRFTGAANPGSMSIAMLIALAALGGLLLNVMPCVLPVISLKVLSFVQQSGRDPRRTRILGVMFGLGVIASFWVLLIAVVVIRSTAQQIGWGFQFQSPIFVLVMSAVVLAFAMTLFGVAEISGPALSGSIVEGHGAGGAFLHGALATILATPCTAPFLGTAIGFAFTQSLPILFLTFTAAAIGLAFPYVVLSWNPALLRMLPRPGPWMIAFKQAMGFVLLGTVVWLLAILGSQLGTEGIVAALAFLTIVALAVWIVGRVPFGAGAGKRWSWRFVAIALVACSYLFIFEHELRWREPVTADTQAIRWQPFSLADLQARVDRGETVLVDFTADWCWNCKVNERTVLSTATVQKNIRDLRITPMKADWTRRNPEITRLLAKFGRAGVPFYAIFPAHRLTSPIALSEIITPASVADALKRAGGSTAR
ncbi:MAG TPA: protein-disulfide reductase DsbD domain-containing protein, partial [Thermoanaerobaculia bacterium]|nr:protein-disulfide reductase DsbD domain-containing protein [Thermoanaerobaculia bacterium]